MEHKLDMHLSGLTAAQSDHLLTIILAFVEACGGAAGGGLTQTEGDPDASDQEMGQDPAETG